MDLLQVKLIWKSCVSLCSVKGSNYDFLCNIAAAFLKRVVNARQMLKCLLHSWLKDLAYFLLGKYFKITSFFY